MTFIFTSMGKMEVEQVKAKRIAPEKTFFLMTRFARQK